MTTSYEPPEPAGEPPNYDGGNRILLVEDDATVAAGLIALLDLEGFSVTHAATGNEALIALRGNTPDAVILDIGLPDMDGRSVYATIAETNPTLPVILSSGHPDPELEDLLVHPNVQYLLKPYGAKALMAALARAMTQVAPA